MIQKYRAGLLALLLLGMAGCARTADNRLFIYNWADYIGTGTIERFERLTGIKVVYDQWHLLKPQRR